MIYKLIIFVNRRNASSLIVIYSYVKFRNKKHQTLTALKHTVQSQRLPDDKKNLDDNPCYLLNLIMLVNSLRFGPIKIIYEKRNV